MPPAHVGMNFRPCRGRCSALPRPGTCLPDCGSVIRRPVARHAATGPATRSRGRCGAAASAAASRQVRHHTSPGIWCRPIPTYIGDARIAVQRAVVVVAGRSPCGADVVAAVHLAGRLVPGDRRVGVAVPSAAGRRRRSRSPSARAGSTRPRSSGSACADNDQPGRVPAVVDVDRNEQLSMRRRRSVGSRVARVPDHVAGGGVVPLVEEAVEALQALHLVERRAISASRLRAARSAPGRGGDDRPEVDADVRRRRVGLPRRRSRRH